MLGCVTRGRRTGAEESAEAYLLDHLAPEEAQVFEEHYIACARCAGIVEETNTLIGAMQQAAERLRRRTGT